MKKLASYNGLFYGGGYSSKTIFGSTHIVEKLLLYSPSIKTFSFDLDFGAFLTFLGPNWLFWGWGRVVVIVGL